MTKLEVAVDGDAMFVLLHAYFSTEQKSVKVLRSISEMKRSEGLRSEDHTEIVCPHRDRNGKYGNKDDLA